jgi:hypothetical protein
MKWRAVILLLFFSIVQSSTSWAGKTTPFYVPPVMRLDLDPLQWELPYFQPWYFLAKSFEPHQMVEIKGRNFNLEITRKFPNHAIDFFSSKCRGV